MPSTYSAKSTYSPQWIARWTSFQVIFVLDSILASGPLETSTLSSDMLSFLRHKKLKLPCTAVGISFIVQSLLNQRINYIYLIYDWSKKMPWLFPWPHYGVGSRLDLHKGLPNWIIGPQWAIKDGPLFVGKWSESLLLGAWINTPPRSSLLHYNPITRN